VMAGCFSSSGADSAKTKHSKAIDKELKAKTKLVQHKILLLGTGNSGKSTFCKQLTKSFGGSNPHCQSTNEEVVMSLRDNTLTGIQKLLRDCTARAAKDSKDWPPEKLKDALVHLTEVTPQTMDSQTAEAVQEVFSDPYVSEILEKYGDQMALPGGTDGLKFFVERIDKYVDPSYTHTQDDLLRNRIKTTGIVESKFICGGIEFIICDVAGQRSERRKWIHCFNSVSAVIYLTSVNEYDIGIEEATNQNSFTDSIQQWKVISDLQCFKTTPFIVFFNKFDLLPAKLDKSPLSKVFRDFDLFIQQENKTDDVAVDKAIAYFTGVFQKNFGGDFVEFHTTCALDPKSCVKVFESVQRSIIQRSLEASGLVSY